MISKEGTRMYAFLEKYWDEPKNFKVNHFKAEGVSEVKVNVNFYNNSDLSSNVLKKEDKRKP